MDADEELYFRVEGKEYTSVGGLDDNERSELIERLDVSPEIASEALKSDPEMLRNPNLLRKLAGGAIGIRDVKNLSAYGLTSKFINRRLGRDKKLRKTLEKHYPRPGFKKGSQSCLTG